MVMLNRAIKIITLLLLVSCMNNMDTQNTIKKRSITVVGISTYNQVLKQINDTVNSWKLNRLRDYIENKNESQYIVDSLLCFNTNGDRLVTCLIGKSLIKPDPTGGVTYLLGEKINNQWYFFKSGHYFIPYESKKIKDGQPFGYEELHEIALKEVYGGYLKPQGEINESWFINLFEGSGWGDLKNQEYNDWCFNGKRYADLKEYYKAVHLCKVKANWASRDTAKLIEQLP